MKRKFTVIFGVVVFAFSIGAQAQMQGPCVEDIKKFCPNEKPGTPKALMCLQPHLSELAPACQQRVNARGNRAHGGGIQGMLTACKGDLDKFCKGVQPGGGRYRACLKEHEKEITPDCKNALPPDEAKAATTPGPQGSQDKKAEEKPAEQKKTEEKTVEEKKPEPTANGKKE